jgi:hypothetical protein
MQRFVETGNVDILFFQLRIAEIFVHGCRDMYLRAARFDHVPARRQGRCQSAAMSISISTSCAVSCMAMRWCLTALARSRG